MSERKISFDTATLDAKILVDDDQFLVMSATIASEIVHRYEDGWAYKPADELEKMAKTAAKIGAVPVKILRHPTEDTSNLLVRHDDVDGRAENFRYVKNLTDPKTKRPCRKGVKADIRWFKDTVPEPIIEETRKGILKDVSIGFVFDKDSTQGEWNGQKYDYAQRNIFLQHVAAPIESGRCPEPFCGIGFDQNIMKHVQIAGDPALKIETDKVVKRGDKWCVVHCHGEEEGEVIKCFATKEEAEAMHRAIEANKHDQGEKPPKEWMDKCKSVVSEGNPNYSEEQVNAVCGNIWYHKPEQQGIGDIIEKDCPICMEIKKLGVFESSKRLAIAYGKDNIVNILKAEKPVKSKIEPKPQSTEELLLEVKKTVDSARWLFE